MNISFRLKPGRDNEIIDWVNTLGDKDRSYYIREALKFYINHGGNAHKMKLSPVSPSKCRKIGVENHKSETHELTQEEKPINNNDLDSVLNDWADSV